MPLFQSGPLKLYLSSSFFMFWGIKGELVFEEDKNELQWLKGNWIKKKGINATIKTKHQLLTILTS